MKQRCGSSGVEPSLRPKCNDAARRQRERNRNRRRTVNEFKLHPPDARHFCHPLSSSSLLACSLSSFTTIPSTFNCRRRSSITVAHPPISSSQRSTILDRQTNAPSRLHTYTRRSHERTRDSLCWRKHQASCARTPSHPLNTSKDGGQLCSLALNTHSLDHDFRFDLRQVRSF